ncbi:putative secreted protein (Por secretion system target) [Winogradskyella eximia]|uniref:Putative secreted protein (Por secretion system target) n=1 Tax=Winogradskyella eximia TaxID=262006 RepID=A0A3D9HBR3_9FLAO|nr:T9SS type A sorting domain-containing protein [Winogradskyella eximia]RED46920.1 putative secreted protein (Por secretion system target) [Winogradskyella eximia]
MLKLKHIFFVLTLFLFFNKTQAQYLWYENITETEDILLTNSSYGVFTTNETNPDINGENTNTICSKFVRQAYATEGYTNFELENPIETALTYTVSLKGYINVRQNKLSSSPKRLRLYLKNTTTGDQIYKQIDFTVASDWENFTFVFNASDFTTSGLESGGYNQMYIGYGNGIFSRKKTTYFIDQIYGTTDQTFVNTVPVSLQGSWGARLYVRAGETLDDYVNDGYDYVAGAQEIISSYPSMGHVITNATNNAKSFLWTLRTNENVDAVMGVPNSIIDEEFVPSIANEQVIIDVINAFKSANKKVILYLNGMSPANRASATGAQSWNDYVAQYFYNDEHAAWMNFCEGYIKRFEELGVDGYWIDAFNSYPGNDTDRAEFVQMIRNVDPDALISANYDKDYFTDSNGDFLMVDTDEVEDIDETDYKIIKLTVKDPWSDMTAGHITPLGQGAPPNSWAYEEFTVPDIQASPTTSYDGSKLAVKHLFLPIRSTWSSERSDLMYEGEQAYRFVKNITDAGGAVTFSTTTDTDGTTMEDEETVLKFVDQQLVANAAASQYVRPVGAFLVGEEQIYPWYENNDNTITDYISVESTLHGTTIEDFSNPFQTGNNTSNTVAKFVRDGGKTGRIYFDLPNPITDLTSLKISLDAFVDIANPVSVDTRIRVFLFNTTLNTRIYEQLTLSTGQTWENLEFDFSAQGTYPDGYNQMAIGFANGDSSGATTTYYVDNVKGAINQHITTSARASNNSENSSTKLIFIDESQLEQDAPLKIYPNPVTSSFKLSKAFQSISIYNIAGKKLLEFSDSQSSFDVSNLKAGFYILLTNYSDGNKEVLRFVKK